MVSHKATGGGVSGEGRATKTGAERQAAYRAKKRDAGLQQVSDFVHPAQAPDVYVLLRLLRENPGWEIAQVRDTKTGRLIAVR